MVRAGRNITRQAAGGLTVGLLLAACGGASDAADPSGPTAAHTHAPPAPAPAPAPEADVLPAPVEPGPAPAAALSKGSGRRPATSLQRLLAYPDA